MGSWKITEKLCDIIFRIKHSSTSPDVVIHSDNLKRYYGDKHVDVETGSQQVMLPNMPNIQEIVSQNNNSISKADISKIGVSEKNTSQNGYLRNGVSENITHEKDTIRTRVSEYIIPEKEASKTTEIVPSGSKISENRRSKNLLKTKNYRTRDKDVRNSFVSVLLKHNSWYTSQKQILYEIKCCKQSNIR